MVRAELGCVPGHAPGIRELVEDPDRSLERLRGFKTPGGSVSYIAGDWFEKDLPPGAFGVVHCRNSLRCATKPYWRRSLDRFRELLSPGGVLLLENVNAIGIQDEVEETAGRVRVRAPHDRARPRSGVQVRRQQVADRVRWRGAKPIIDSFVNCAA